MDSRALRGGDGLGPGIEEAITEAAHVVVVISPATVNSEWVSREGTAAETPSPSWSCACPSHSNETRRADHLLWARAVLLTVP